MYMLAYLYVEYVGNIPYLHKGCHMDAHDRTASRLGDAPRPMTSWELSPPLMSYFGVAVLAPVKSGAIDASHQTAADGTLLHNVLRIRHMVVTYGTKRSYDTWSVRPFSSI